MTTTETSKPSITTEKLEADELSLRPVLHRQSKNTHRFLGDSSQNAKDPVQSKLGKKTSRKKF